jgi:hypothetical protein
MVRLTFRACRGERAEPVTVASAQCSVKGDGRTARTAACTWTLDAILLAHPTTCGPFTNVDQSDACNEADGCYLLECTLLDVPPKHRKTIRIGF